MLRTRFSPRGYVASLLRDVRASAGRVSKDRAGLAAILLFVLPWWSLVFLREDAGWVPGFVEIVSVVVLVWWMSRSGSAPAPEIKRPMLEAVLAIGLVVLWVEWRAGICTKTFPFLPADFSCFDNVGYEVIPKLVDCVVVPFVVLRTAGYGLHAQGVDWNWRSWWIILPVLVAAIAYGLYIHADKPFDFAQTAFRFFFAAGLPEELLFRSVLLTRLEAWWRSPGWALFGASAIFGLSHLPIDYLVFTKQDWREAWITLLTFQMGFGFAFGFAYQRTRNIWPIAVLHAVVDAL